MNKIGTLLLFCFAFVATGHNAVFAQAAVETRLSSRIDNLLAGFTIESSLTTPAGQPAGMTVGPGIRIEQCRDYPYHNQLSPVEGYITLANDIREGLRTGLQCLAGNGPMGELHAYHRQQAQRLLDILESEQTKTFRCVADQTFAYAVAKAPPAMFERYEYDAVIRELPYPSVAIDTYRLSGFLTRQHEPSTYREFFKLNEQQISEHLAGHPQRLASLHRYQNLPELVFHEMTHWLGHAHTNMSPDVVDLYDTCCFGGSDFIDDADSNDAFKQRACNILKDSELWEASPEQQKVMWRKKGYDQLKPDMRKLYN